MDFKRAFFFLSNSSIRIFSYSYDGYRPMWRQNWPVMLQLSCCFYCYWPNCDIRMAVSSRRYNRSVLLLISVGVFVVRRKTIPRNTLLYVEFLSVTLHCQLVFWMRLLNSNANTDISSVDLCRTKACISSVSCLTQTGVVGGGMFCASLEVKTLENWPLALQWR